MKAILKHASAAVAIALSLLLHSGCSRDDRTIGQSVDDAAVTTKIKAAFAKDPGVSAMAVHVTTYRGTVQLSGWVNTPEEKAKAEELAKAVPGVKSVDNQISIKSEVGKPKTQ